jgi:hypothetical protein
VAGLHHPHATKAVPLGDLEHTRPSDPPE